MNDKTDLQRLLDRAARTKNQDIVQKPKLVDAVSAPAKKRISKRLKRAASVVLVVLIVAMGVLLYIQHSQKGDIDPATLVAEVGKLVALPPGETPTIATVTDPKALASQAFFKDAEAGDKVLIYSKLGKAILYRPSTQQVIVVAPLTKQ